MSDATVPLTSLPPWFLHVVSPDGGGWLGIDLRCCEAMEYLSPQRAIELPARVDRAPGDHNGTLSIQMPQRVFSFNVPSEAAEAAMRLWLSVRGDMECLP